MSDKKKKSDLSDFFFSDMAEKPVRIRGPKNIVSVASEGTTK